MASCDLDLQRTLDNVRASVPLVHCITNYVTVNDCANALLACGGSPIMSDEPEDVEDITTICGGLLVNIGTLNARSIEAMRVAGARAAELGHPIVLDPVGAGASALRTKTASELADSLPIAVIRGNMSEIKALAGAAAATRGVDANPDDAVSDENLQSSAAFVRELARTTGSVVAVTGSIDIVADADRVFAIRNGVPMMSKITGTGCMLSCIVAAYAVANPDDVLGATVAAVSGMGVAGQRAFEALKATDGNATFRTNLIDALYRMTSHTLAVEARVEEVRA